MNLKKLIIFPVILFLILFTIGFILTDGMKYSGLNEFEIKTFKEMERGCEYAPDKSQCQFTVDKLIETAKQMGISQVQVTEKTNYDGEFCIAENIEDC